MLKNNSNRSLLEKIYYFNLDSEEQALSFSRRLARENNWVHTYAKRVIHEYKRFVYMVAIADQEVTPSDQVDQAWHLHLTYTQSYWHELCHNILGFELHHIPTEGGDKETARFKQQYIDTLTLYEKIFQEKPPSDIWPSVEQRFESADAFVRVNQQQQWIIPKPDLKVFKWVAVITFPFFLAACTESFEDKDIWFWLKVALGVFIIYKIASWMDGGKGSGGGGAGCGSGCGGCSSG